MRAILLGFLFAATGCAGHAVEPGGGSRLRVLFIGNSLTAVNDLPHTVSALAAMAQDTIEVEAVTRPDFAVIDHLNGGSNALDVLRNEPWDFVVLQQGPTSLPIYRDTLILATELLEPDVRAAGGRVAQLMTWPAAANREVFDGVLQSCLEAARAVEGGICLPAGQAWREAWVVDTTLPLYGPDGFHPSELGTYLAALVIYEGLTGHDARSLPNQAYANGHLLDVSLNTIERLRRVAHEVVVAYRGTN